MKLATIRTSFRDLQDLVNFQTVNGPGASGLKLSLTLLAPNTSGAYQAIESISIVEPFSTASGADFSGVVTGGNGILESTVEGMTVWANPIPGVSTFELLIKTGYDTHTTIPSASDPSQNGDERLSRIAQVAHESGHTWRKKHNLDPAVPTPPSFEIGQKNFTEKLNNYTVKSQEGSRTRELGASQLENIVLSELMNSGSGNFKGLNLRATYFSLATYETDYTTGKMLYIPSAEDYNTLQSPRTREYYLNTKLNIYNEHSVQSPK